MEMLDVFLTTLKPPQKVVTAQDITASLYYMHVDRPEDHELIRSYEDSEDLSDEDNGRGKHATVTGGVRRKPLPPNATPGFVDRLEPPPEVNPYFQTHSNGAKGSPQVERNPLRQGNMAEHRPVDVRPPLPDRKLLGPRPMHQRFLSVGSPTLQDVPEKQNIDLRRWSQQPPKLPPRPFSGRKDSIPVTPPRPLAASLKNPLFASGGRSRVLHRKPIAPPASYDTNREMKDGSNAMDLLQDTSLTLIRRYGTEQETVGKILTRDTVSPHGQSSQGVSIHIMTRGYLRFIDPIDSLAKQAPIVTEKSDGIGNSDTPVTAAEEQLCFQRHLQVSGHAMSRNQKRRPESTDSASSHQGTRLSSDLPRQSSDSAESSRSCQNASPELMLGSKKGYFLRSPWNGSCEFTTGVAGRSFKCKHSYASSNPRFGPGMHSAQVSELRFNLPSSKTLGSPASKSLVPGTPREAKRSSLFLHQHQRRSSSSFEAKGTHGSEYFAPKVELEERLDLSLGQEHAGGGFGGKQAKLGKLIIENEGLQMLDLIIAVNMALWWRVYERFT